MQVLFYGPLTDLLENKDFHPQGIANTDQLIKKLNQCFPAMSAITYSIAVNNRIVPGNTPLLPDDVVSLLPPFSGG
jgi:molybdopterin converting factor small subunit